MDKVAEYTARLHLAISRYEMERLAEEIVDELTVQATGDRRTYVEALMAFADTLGAIGTMVNLPDGAQTTTMESKTNFIAAGPTGMVLTAEGTRFHRRASAIVLESGAVAVSAARPAGPTA